MLKVNVRSSNLTSVLVGVGSTQPRRKVSRQVIHQHNSNLSPEIHTNGPRLLTKGIHTLKSFLSPFVVESSALMLRGVHLVCLDDGGVTDALTALPCFLKFKPIQAGDIRHFLSPPYLSGILIHKKKKNSLDSKQ